MCGEELMTMDEEYIHFDERGNIRRVREFEKLLNLYLSRILSENRSLGYRFELISEEEKPFDANEQILKLSSEVQELKNQFNKYMKIETREESVNQLRQLVSRISEVKEIYARHKADSVIFSVFYDQGDRLDILEKVVDVEIELERIFKTLNLDFRVLPYSEAIIKMFSPSELVYTRKETRTSAQLPLA
jgi:hypothetical protein